MTQATRASPTVTLAALFLMTAMMVTAPAHAARKKRDPRSEACAEELDRGCAQRARQSPHVKFERQSRESARDKERRLIRECRSRPNAGACLGYGI
ncbi:hypothetical protein [Ottowia thiooxydans]|uniref:hypothetical protein n=1 Tax=Ottowia thiooxydans TaxID=219182 RepID=UPI0033944D60